ncbi:MAG: hypothetical protein QXZ09_06065 [Candidatus Methanomethylicaceae archaeon]
MVALVVASVISVAYPRAEGLLLPVEPANVIDELSLRDITCPEERCQQWLEAQVTAYPGEVICAQRPSEPIACALVVLSRAGMVDNDYRILVSIAGPARFALISCSDNRLRLGRLVLKRTLLGPEEAISFYFRVDHPPTGLCFWDTICMMVALPRNHERRYR